MAGKPASTASTWTIADTQFRLNLKRCNLILKRPILSDAVYAEHTRALASGKVAIYDHFRSDCKWMTIPAALKTFYSQDLFGSTSLPAKVYVVFFDQDRLAGKYETSSQVYVKPPNLKFCGLELDGRPLGDFGSFAGTYAAGLDKFQHRQIMNQTQCYYKPEAVVPDISLDSFNERHFILCYDLTAAGFVSSNTFPLIKTGSLRLHMEFTDSGLAKNMTCLIFSTNPATLAIDNNRMVSINYRTG